MGTEDKQFATGASSEPGHELHYQESKDLRDSVEDVVSGGRASASADADAEMNYLQRDVEAVAISLLWLDVRIVVMVMVCNCYVLLTSSGAKMGDSTSYSRVKNFLSAPSEEWITMTTKVHHKRA